MHRTEYVHTRIILGHFRYVCYSCYVWYTILHFGTLGHCHVWTSGRPCMITGPVVVWLPSSGRDSAYASMIT